MTEKAKRNMMAVASLILGVLSILLPTVGIVLGIIGIVLSVIARNQIKKTNETGTGIAKAGRICSIVGACIQMLLIVVGIISVFSSPVG